MKTLRAHGFNQRPRFEQVVDYLERNEPLPLDQPDSKATSFITSHFYLDDFVQSSEGPNPRPPAAHAPAGNSRGRLPHSRTNHGRGCAPCAEVPRRKGPPSITDRLRSTADGAQAAADLIGAGGRGACSRAGLPLSAAPGRRYNTNDKDDSSPRLPSALLALARVDLVVRHHPDKFEDLLPAGDEARAEGLGGRGGRRGGVVRRIGELLPQLQVVQDQAVAVVGNAQTVRGLAIGGGGKVGADPGGQPCASVGALGQQRPVQRAQRGVNPVLPMLYGLSG